MMTADAREAALIALRPSCNADGSAVIDKTMAELVAFLRRDDFPKSLFHLGGLLHVIDKADEIAEADAVRVGHDGRLSVNVAENEVGALSADAGER